MRLPTLALAALLLSALTSPVQAAPPAAGADPLPSWNDGPNKTKILAFVRQVTDKDGKGYIEPEERIATFDQDGTLWVEHPLYAQGEFALDRLKKMAPQHPEWKEKEPFKSLLAGESPGKLSESDWMEIVTATHAGMSTADFAQLVSAWRATARDPRWKKPYTELVYQPMLELMAYLRANGFQTYIVTGGGQAFVRDYAQEVYDLQPEQVIGSSLATKYKLRNGKPILLRDPKAFLFTDRGGKPVGIDLIIGKRPILAFGNSDGDREMLEYTTMSPDGNGPRLGGLILHSDAEREYAYGPAAGLPNTKVGTFSEELYQEGKERGWLIVDMKRDWKRIFRFRSVAGSQPPARE